MNIKDLKAQADEIWGDENLEIKDVIVLMGKVYGDICRYARNAKKDAGLHNDEELKKELGNIIFSTIRWADKLGYDPEECIKIAIKAQKEFEK